jgi:hypothetical protein
MCKCKELLDLVTAGQEAVQRMGYPQPGYRTEDVLGVTDDWESQRVAIGDLQATMDAILRVLVIGQCRPEADDLEDLLTTESDTRELSDIQTVVESSTAVMQRPPRSCI